MYSSYHVIFVTVNVVLGLPSHPQHELAKTQCTGFGGMVSFRVKGDKNRARTFLMNLKVRILTVLHTHDAALLFAFTCMCSQRHSCIVYTSEYNVTIARNNQKPRSSLFIVILTLHTIRSSWKRKCPHPH